MLVCCTVRDSVDEAGGGVCVRGVVGGRVGLVKGIRGLWFSGVCMEAWEEAEMERGGSVKQA